MAYLYLYKKPDFVWAGYKQALPHDSISLRLILARCNDKTVTTCQEPSASWVTGL